MDHSRYWKVQIIKNVTRNSEIQLFFVVQEKYSDCFLFLSLIRDGLSNESISCSLICSTGALCPPDIDRKCICLPQCMLHEQNKHLLHLYYSSLGRPISPHTIQLSLTVFLSRFHICAAFLFDMLLFNTSSTAFIALTSESMNRQKITFYLQNFWKLHKNFIF